MSWYRIFSQTPQNPKLAAIARRTGLKRGEVLSIWVALLDHASSAPTRGSLAGLDAEELAGLLEFELAPVQSVLAALRDRKMILADESIAAWEKHHPLSTARTRALRARRAAALSDNRAAESDEERRTRLTQQLRTRRGATLTSYSLTAGEDNDCY